MNDHASDTPAPNWQIDLTGRATSTGSKQANRKLANDRAKQVDSQLSGLLTGVTINPFGNPDQGNSKTDESDKYRRVEAIFKDANLRDIEQTKDTRQVMFG